MAQKIIYLCSNCKSEWAVDLFNPQPTICAVCGSSKIYRSTHHQRYAKKRRSKVRWSYKV